MWEKDSYRAQKQVQVFGNGSVIKYHEPDYENNTYKMFPYSAMITKGCFKDAHQVVPKITYSVICCTDKDTLQVRIHIKLEYTSCKDTLYQT